MKAVQKAQASVESRETGRPLCLQKIGPCILPALHIGARRCVVLGQQFGRQPTGVLQQGRIVGQVGKPQQGVATLPRAHEFTRAADL